MSFDARAHLSSQAGRRALSDELTRLLRLDPTTVVEPAETPDLRVELINRDCPVDDLIPRVRRMLDLGAVLSH